MWVEFIQIKPGIWNIIPWDEASTQVRTKQNCEADIKEMARRWESVGRPIVSGTCIEMQKDDALKLTVGRHD
jgi:hypothetical protein